jgi:hypothetical protein
VWFCDLGIAVNVVGKRWDLPAKVTTQLSSWCLPFFPFSRRSLSKTDVSECQAETEEEVSKLRNASFAGAEDDEENAPENNGLSIMFDIDDTLVYEHMIGRKQNESLIVPTKFEHDGEVVIEDFHVIPGVYELLQYLKNGKETQIAFFSGGVKGRNEVLVSILLQKAFPDDHERILGESSIFSRHHLSGYCCTRKNLTVVSDHYKASTKRPIRLDNIILIDDRPCLVEEGQNVLSVLPSEIQDEERRVFSQNRIFYTTGVLDALFASSSSMTTAEFLSKHHVNCFKKDLEMKDVQPFVLKGLEILQGYNPELKLI